jgi:S1-C subfamily serine protease
MPIRFASRLLLALLVIAMPTNLTFASLTPNAPVDLTDHPIDRPVPGGISEPSRSVYRITALLEMPVDVGIYQHEQSHQRFIDATIHLRRARGLGFALDDHGTILTLAHVVAGSNSVWVVDHLGIVRPALVVGTDPRSDLAVLRIHASTEPLAISSDASLVRTLFARVHPTNVRIESTLPQRRADLSFEPLDQIDASFIGTNRWLPTLSRRTGRAFDRLIEVRAENRPGDSGAVALDIHNRAVGILTAVIERPDTSPDRRGSSSAFLLPFDALQIHRIEELKSGRPIPHPYIGARLTDSPAGVRVDAVDPDSPAHGSLLPGDLIIGIADDASPSPGPPHPREARSENRDALQQLPTTSQNTTTHTASAQPPVISRQLVVDSLVTSNGQPLRVLIQRGPTTLIALLHARLRVLPEAPITRETRRFIWNGAIYLNTPALPSADAAFDRLRSPTDPRPLDRH